jgi:formylglycine-generating enzyme required for sulfatase activity
MNPEIRMNAKDNDPPRMKRKVVRGGSWKDVGFFLQNSTRTYEYQDTTKSYVGFRCVIDLPPTKLKK